MKSLFRGVRLGTLLRGRSYANAEKLVGSMMLNCRLRNLGYPTEP
jgi:hypothetical protein